MRKSGLTFAVETPKAEAQRGINKEVPVEQVVDILLEARRRGWNTAKFYFMIGLPEELGTEDEAEAIVEYLEQVRRETGFKLNVNIGTFIPKPHTPFQWARQLSEEEALSRIKKVKEAFRRSPVKVSYHSPFISLLEGLISRGDKRVGDIILAAYRKGARLDAWEEYVDFDIWREVFSEAGWDVVETTLRRRDLDESLPWDLVDLGINREYLSSELQRAENYELTPECDFPCSHHCGVCVKKIRPVRLMEKDTLDRIPAAPKDLAVPEGEENEGRWYLFCYRKKDKARYLSHINVMTVFERSFQRAGLRLMYTQGFNPKPRIDFAHPLSLGLDSEVEIGRCKLYQQNHGEEELLDVVNDELPQGFQLQHFRVFRAPFDRGRGRSLQSLYGGSAYRIESWRPADASIEALYRKIESFLRDKKSNALAAFDSGAIQIFTPAVGAYKFSIKDIYHLEAESIAEFLSRYQVTRTGLALITGDQHEQESLVRDPRELGNEYLQLSS